MKTPPLKAKSGVTLITHKHTHTDGERENERVTKRRSRWKGRVSTRGVGDHEERNQRFKLYIDIMRKKRKLKALEQP